MKSTAQKALVLLPVVLVIYFAVAWANQTAGTTSTWLGSKLPR